MSNRDGRAENSLVTDGKRDPVAIIGLACRLPSAPDIDAFWDVLCTGKDVVGQLPSTRADGTADPGNLPGGFLDDISKFDAQFFGISPREAVRLDPALRLLMETTWEALEDGGLTVERLRGSRTGVYTSFLPTGYWDMLSAAGQQDLHGAFGAGPWQMPSARISQFLDLRGPSMGIDAQCASSLVATHLACRAIWSGEIDQALVGGVNLLLSGDLFPILADAHVLSPAGHCRFGDAGADGYVRSEAVASAVLKPWRQAVRDGDRIYAVVTGSSVTHVGRSGGGIFSPGQEGQEAAIEAAYADAEVSPDSIGYVEAHGTGTTAGDRVELAALRQVLAQGRPPGNPCLVGSLKSNFGHAEIAAGIVGLLKGALAVHHRVVPATLHVEQPNPVVRDQGPGDEAVELAVHTQPWPEWNTIARAGVNAFGLAGTNTHIVLAEPPASRRRRSRRRPTAPHMLPIAASSPQALAETVQAYAALLESPESSMSTADLCFSAGTRRSHHDHRLAVYGDTRQELADGLRSYASGRPARSVVTGQRPAAGTPQVVFVFPGQGGQWSAMGRDLITSSKVYADRIGECSDAVQAELGWSLAKALSNGDPLERVDQVQPAIWAVQVALAALWSAWGIQPDLVMGHSLGEIAAATVAGALTVTDAAAVVSRRSKLLAELPKTGAMWVVQLGEQAAQAAIAGHDGQISVGVINSDHSTVLSGERAALEEVVDALRQADVFCRQVPVDYASHSALMDQLEPDLTSALSDVRPSRGRMPFYSPGCSRVVRGQELDGAYWMDNLRQPVRFAQAVKTVAAEPTSTLFVEISPHPLLAPDIEAVAGTGRAVTSLRRGEPSLDTLLASLATVYVSGCLPRWERLSPGGAFVGLPSYPWQRRRYWADPVSPLAPAPKSVAGPAVRQQAELPAAAAPAELPPAPARPALPLGPPDGAVPALLGRLCEWTATTLAMSPAEIDPGQTLSQLGVESVLAMSLQVRVSEQLGLQIPTDSLLGNRTLADLARDWCAQLSGQSAQADSAILAF